MKICMKYILSLEVDLSSNTQHKVAMSYPKKKFSRSETKLQVLDLSKVLRDFMLNLSVVLQHWSMLQYYL